MSETPVFAGGAFDFRLSGSRSGAFPSISSARVANDFRGCQNFEV
jgi:hypothetical protein